MVVIGHLLWCLLGVRLTLIGIACLLGIFSPCIAK
jgi:hypothetical protein